VKTSADIAQACATDSPAETASTPKETAYAPVARPMASASRVIDLPSIAECG